MSQTATAPGRTYCVTSDPPASGRLYDAAGAQIPFAHRTEFEADADEGVATVYAHATDAAGKLVIDPVTRRTEQRVFRAWVKYVPKAG